MAERAGRRREVTASEPGRLLRALFGVVAFVGLIGFVVATVIQFATTGSDDWQRRMLENGLLWLVGVQGWVYAGGHLFFADQVADSIGWGRGSPFQFEVGLANLSYGVLGVFASSYGRDWWLATVVAFGVLPRGCGRTPPAYRRGAQLLAGQRWASPVLRRRGAAVPDLALRRGHLADSGSGAQGMLRRGP